MKYIWMTVRKVVTKLWKMFLALVMLAPPSEAEVQEERKRSREEEVARVRRQQKDRAEEEKLHGLNRTWREMLRDDPWRKKLMTHVRLLCSAFGIFFLTFYFSGLYLPAKHPIFNYITAGIAASIPYWFWVGNWNRIITEKVLKKFKERFGDNFHLW